MVVLAILSVQLFLLMLILYSSLFKIELKVALHCVKLQFCFCLMSIDRTSFCKPMAKRPKSTTNVLFTKAEIIAKNAVLFRARKFDVFTARVIYLFYYS